MAGFIFEKMYDVLDFGINEGYSLITNYDLNWEINLQKDDKVGTLYRDKEYVDITYKPYSQIIKSNFESILSDIKQILVDIHLDENFNIFKYDKIEEKIEKSTIPFFEVPKILVVLRRYSDDAWNVFRR